MYRLVKIPTIKLMRSSLIIIILLTVLTACDTTSKLGLDLQNFYKEGKENAIYPSVKQIGMLDEFIPEETYQPSPSILNRTYW